jgi:hypothetical protein
MAVTPIQEADLSEVCDFLNAQLNRKIDVAAWRYSVIQPWTDSRPNFGMQLRDGRRIVGVFLAIYSVQNIDGIARHFCNPHSWCVLQEYRQQSISLVLALVKQKGYTFTMLTPNPKVAEVFKALKFAPLSREMVAHINVPPWSLWSGTARVESDPTKIEALLCSRCLVDYKNHRHISWLRFLAIGEPGMACLLVYKLAKWKRLPAVRLLHIGDAATLDRYFPLYRRHMLFVEHMFSTLVERRLLTRAPLLSLQWESMQNKLWLGSEVSEVAITNLYSELTSLNI